MYKSFVTAACLVLSGLCFADRDKSGGDGLLTNWVEIANSLTDFGPAQGENNWWYMWSSEVNGARQEMTYFESCGQPLLWQVECATGTYCHISPWGQHPDTSPSLRMPVRRYVFQESGTYRINLWLQHDLSGQTSSCVEGVTLYALIDGQEVWSAVTVQNTDNLFEYTGDFEVNAGTILELVSHPHQYDCSDGHSVSIVIEAAQDDEDSDGIDDLIDNCYLYNPNQADCNGNEVGDICDIADETSSDWNGNEIPDECECLADIALDDGQVNVHDLLSLIAVWGTDSSTADINFDGIVNVHDLLQLVATWGDCS